MPNMQFKKHNPQAHGSCCHHHVSVHNFEKIFHASSFLKLKNYISFLWKTLKDNGENCKNVSFSNFFAIMTMGKERWVGLHLPYFYSQTLLYNSRR